MEKPVKPARSQSRWLSYPVHWLTLSAVLGIAGCAGTKTSDFQMSASALPSSQPDTVLVSVMQTQVVSAFDPDEQTRVRDLAAALQGQLVEKLKRPSTRIVVLPVNGVTPDHAPGTLLLRCSIVEAKGGNEALRLAFGFGAGRATLRVHTDLLDLSEGSPMTVASWDTNSTTGAMPGPALGLAGAVQAGQALAMVGGSVGMLLGMRQTQAREVDQSSTEIALRLQSAFQTRNWTNPSTTG